MIGLFKALPVVAATVFMSASAQASITFTFAESGGNVTMESSGILDTQKLVSVAPSGWGGAGVANNSPSGSDSMGDTTMGNIDIAFGFHSGTDLSAWFGNMFTSSNYGWTSSGTTQFTTYYYRSTFPTYPPGIGISAADMAGSLWTPDVSWTKAGTLTSLGLTVGTYAVTDATTNESITIQIGQTVPEPGSLALLGLGLAGLAANRKRKQA